ncbi:uncharacterized protein LOC133197434 [Saccostrea echinata]|uniref:uncharacterized protein LOC133197434 n=1 Tax=Saccostrea echinata TaxID=191078 RepID=UPI002A819644|nr:uncharacterized protein LOC133197434 [Saccostrea echinata]
MAEGDNVEDPDIVYAQHFIECELCSNIVSLHCTVCKVSLCGECIGAHVNAKPTQEHNIVSFKLRASIPILPPCTSHKNEKCNLLCTKCQIPVCVNCITLQHKAHPAIKLEDKCKQKSLEIEMESESLENNVCKNLEDTIAKMQKELDEVHVKYEKMQTAVTDHGRKWHNEVDRTVQKFSEEIKSMENRDITLLEKQIEESKALLRALRVHCKEVKKFANSLDLKDILDYQLRKETSHRFNFSLTMPSFTPTKIKENKMFETFGNLFSQIPLQVKSFASKQETIRKLCSRSTVCKSVETSVDNICNLVCVNDNTVWLNGESNTMICFKDTGVEIERHIAKLGIKPTNLAITRQGDLIYAIYDSWHSCVYIITNGKTKELITFVDWKPIGVCCTADDKFLVSMESKDETQVKIARFSGSEIIQEIQYDDHHQPLYEAGKYYILVEENKNLDVCASDPNKNEVVVTNKNGAFRWRYKGNLQTGKFESFSPSFICSDSHSQLLVMDTDNECVHLLDMDGVFITYITHPNIHGIGAMSLDRSGRLWIANYKGGQINVFKYLQ